MRTLNIILMTTDGLWCDLWLSMKFLCFGCRGGSKPSDKGMWGGEGQSSRPWDKRRGWSHQKKFFRPFRPQFGPKMGRGGEGGLPWIRHWVEFWLYVTTYTVYTWLKKGRLNFIAFHFTFLCLNVATEIPHICFAIWTWGGIHDQ